MIRILNFLIYPVTIPIVKIISTEEFSVEYYSLSNKCVNISTLNSKNDYQFPLIFITGYGVVGKNIDDKSGIIEMVLNNEKEFYIYKSSSELFFIRWNLLDDIIKKIGLLKREEICNIILINNSSVDNIAKEAKLFFDSNLKVKNIFSNITIANYVCISIYMATRYYIIAFILLLLSSNFIINNSLENDLNALKMERISLEKELKALDMVEKERQKYMELLPNKNQKLYTKMAEEVVRNLPHDIVLTKLNFFPLVKPITKQSLPLVDNTIIIQGISRTLLSITEYLQSLENKPFTKMVNIKQMKIETKGKQFIFDIELKL